MYKHAWGSHGKVTAQVYGKCSVIHFYRHSSGKIRDKKNGYGTRRQAEKEFNKLKSAYEKKGDRNRLILITCVVDGKSEALEQWGDKSIVKRFYDQEESDRMKKSNKKVAKKNPSRQAGGFYIVDTRVGKVVAGPYSVREADMTLEESAGFDHATHQVMDERYLTDLAFKAKKKNPTKKKASKKKVSKKKVSWSASDIKGMQEFHDRKTGVKKKATKKKAAKSRGKIKWSKSGGDYSSQEFPLGGKWKFQIAATEVKAGKYILIVVARNGQNYLDPDYAYYKTSGYPIKKVKEDAQNMLDAGVYTRVTKPKKGHAPYKFLPEDFFDEKDRFSESSSVDNSKEKVAKKNPGGARYDVKTVPSSTKMDEVKRGGHGESLGRLKRTWYYRQTAAGSWMKVGSWANAQALFSGGIARFDNPKRTASRVEKKSKHKRKKGTKGTLSAYARRRPGGGRRNNPAELEGPFTFPNGRVVYYDPGEGKYYDRGTDLYLSESEVESMQSKSKKKAKKNPIKVESFDADGYAKRAKGMSDDQMLNAMMSLHKRVMVDGQRLGPVEKEKLLILSQEACDRGNKCLGNKPTKLPSSKRNPKKNPSRQAGGFYIVDTRVGKVVAGPYSVREADMTLEESAGFDHATHQVMDERYLTDLAFKAKKKNPTKKNPAKKKATKKKVTKKKVTKKKATKKKVSWSASDIKGMQEFHDRKTGVKKKATKKKVTRKKTPEWQLLCNRCAKLWDHYCERPSKARLKPVLAHLEKMKTSTSKRVRDERAACLRAANKEARRLKMK